VPLLPLNVFWPDTGGVHQDYYIRNPERYNYYKNGCGRVKRLKAVWGSEEYYQYHDANPSAINLTVTNAAGEEVPAVLGGDPLLRQNTPCTSPW
jgi:peptide methionine sulfoxide reductase MsrA